MGNVQSEVLRARRHVVDFLGVRPDQHQRDVGGSDLLVSKRCRLDPLGLMDRPEVRIRGRHRRVRHRTKGLFDFARHLWRIHIADNHKSHSRRNIVAAVKIDKTFARSGLDHLLDADWKALRNERIWQNLGKLLFHEAGAHRIAAYLFRENHTALLVDLLAREQSTVAEIPHHGEGKFHRLIRQIGQVQHIHGFIKGSERIDVGPEGNSQPLHLRDQLIRTVILRTIKNHVL